MWWHVITTCGSLQTQILPDVQVRCGSSLMCSYDSQSIHSHSYTLAKIHIFSVHQAEFGFVLWSYSYGAVQSTWKYPFGTSFELHIASHQSKNRVLCVAINCRWVTRWRNENAPYSGSWFLSLVPIHFQSAELIHRHLVSRSHKTACGADKAAP